MSKATEGLWEITYFEHGCEIVSKNDTLIARLSWPPENDEIMKPLTRLIAAAPGLLDMCKEFANSTEPGHFLYVGGDDGLTYCCGCGYSHNLAELLQHADTCPVKRLNAAIAKAEAPE